MIDWPSSAGLADDAIAAEPLLGRALQVVDPPGEDAPWTIRVDHGYGLAGFTVGAAPTGEYARLWAALDPETVVALVDQAVPV